MDFSRGLVAECEMIQTFVSEYKRNHVVGIEDVLPSVKPMRWLRSWMKPSGGVNVLGSIVWCTCIEEWAGRAAVAVALVWQIG